MRCPSCGNDNPDEFPFCIECGSYIAGAPPAREPGERPGASPPERHPQPAPAEPDLSLAPTPRQMEAARPDRPALQDRAPPGPRGRLTVLEGPATRPEFELSGSATSIGRSRANDIVLDDNKVSRRHASIIRTAHGFVIEDLKSRNGVRVNDRTVRGSCPLEDGAVIRIGDSAFRFAQDVGPSREAPGGEAPRPSARTAGSADAVPVIFAAPWTPLQCPRCFAIKTMRPILYGPAATTAAAQEAARRGEVVLGGAAMRPDGPNAQCSSCGASARIIPTTP